MNNLDKFHKLLKEQWDYNLECYPVFATICGDHRFNDRLGSPSEKSMDERIEKWKEFIRRYKEIDASDFSSIEKMNYDIFGLQLQTNLERMEFREYRLPITHFRGFYNNFPRISQLAPFNGLDDYNNYIARLHAIPKYIDEQIEVLQTGLETDYIPARVTLEGIANSIREQIIDDIQESPYFSPFMKFPNTVNNEDQQLLKREAILVIKDKIFPSYLKFANYLDEIYYPAARDTIAVTELPNGREFYQSCIRHFTSLDLRPEEIHEIGMNEVKRIYAEMLQVLEDVNFDGSIDDFKQYLRSNPEFYPKTAEELMEKTARICKKIDGKLPVLFNTLPRLPYGLREIPLEEAPNTTTAYYLKGTGDGTKAGFYYINTFDLLSRPLYEMEALSLHECVPGHHLQLSLQSELELPNFRKFTGITAFVEGWGLYSERLGLEIGFYEDPYSNFGRLSYEMWRACRLVVDTGMHVLGWSRKDAIDFMLKYTSLTELNIKNEIDRYISWPGQSLAYKLGEIKIRELRAKAEKILGNRFNIRKFHDALLLDGALPLKILEKKINSWISSQ